MIKKPRSRYTSDNRWCSAGGELWRVCGAVGIDETEAC